MKPKTRTGVNVELDPTRLVISLPSLRCSEVLAVLDLLDQVTAQLWMAHGDAIAAFMVEERRRHPRTSAVDDLPF
jgi:hypothetical protein